MFEPLKNAVGPFASDVFKNTVNSARQAPFATLASAGSGFLVGGPVGALAAVVGPSLSGTMGQYATAAARPLVGASTADYLGTGVAAGAGLMFNQSLQGAAVNKLQVGGAVAKAMIGKFISSTTGSQAVGNATSQVFASMIQGEDWRGTAVNTALATGSGLVSDLHQRGVIGPRTADFGQGAFTLAPHVAGLFMRGRSAAAPQDEDATDAPDAAAASESAAIPGKESATEYKPDTERIARLQKKIEGAHSHEARAAVYAEEGIDPLRGDIARDPAAGERFVEPDVTNPPCRVATGKNWTFTVNSDGVSAGYTRRDMAGAVYDKRVQVDRTGLGSAASEAHPDGTYVSHDKSLTTSGYESTSSKTGGDGSAEIKQCNIGGGALLSASHTTATPTAEVDSSSSSFMGHCAAYKSSKEHIDSHGCETSDVEVAAARQQAAPDGGTTHSGALFTFDQHAEKFNGDQSHTHFGVGEVNATTGQGRFDAQCAAANLTHDAIEGGNKTNISLAMMPTEVFARYENTSDGLQTNLDARTAVGKGHFDRTGTDGSCDHHDMAILSQKAHADLAFGNRANGLEFSAGAAYERDGFKSAGQHQSAYGARTEYHTELGKQRIAGRADAEASTKRLGFGVSGECSTTLANLGAQHSFAGGGSVGADLTVAQRGYTAKGGTGVSLERGVERPHLKVEKHTSLAKGKLVARTPNLPLTDNLGIAAQGEASFALHPGKPPQADAKIKPVFEDKGSKSS